MGITCITNGSCLSPLTERNFRKSHSFARLKKIFQQSYRVFSARFFGKHLQFSAQNLLVATQKANFVNLSSFVLFQLN
jgi:hypothetical protein